MQPDTGTETSGPPEVTDETWPFGNEADRNDPLTAMRIPVIPNPYPGWKYEVCVVITDDDLWDPALRPDDAEARMIAAYLGYRMEYYNEGWKAKMRKRALDVDATTNTVVLQKRGEGDWCYRRRTWRSGPFMVPARDQEPLGLEALLDRIHFYGADMPAQSWLDWKAAHPEAFGEVPDGN